MQSSLLMAVEYGSYISEIKLIVFLILFFLWLPLVGWVYRDAKVVGTKEFFWTAVVLGTGAAASLIWMILPVFIVGFLFYLIAVAGVSLSYVSHRNTAVLDFQRVLTVEHIKSLFISREKKLDELKSFTFLTANNNEVPVPELNTPDFFGYKTAYDILTDAMWRRASDIIFSPTSEKYKLIYHVDGAALKQPGLARAQMEYFIRFLKNLADLDAEEKRKPQKGKFTIREGNEHTDWEVVTAGSTAGERVRLKPITEESVLRLPDIGLTADQHLQLSKIRDLKRGLFIVSGPRKSGVTTTFYALLRNHDPFIYSVNTLERHPSAELPNITQKVFTLSDTGTTTYAKKLLSVVRMEPDIIGVADCQDSETAQIACKAARDGKIVYVTLEADNVIQAVGKWRKLVGDNNIAAGTLLGISNQRLLRKLCDECRQAYEPNKELLRKFNIPAEKAEVFYREGRVQIDAHGKSRACENCQETGFVGRMGVFEVITMNDELRKVIKDSETLAEIGTQFRRAKMLYLQEQALKKVVNGTTAINEMIRVFSASKKQRASKPEQKK